MELNECDIQILCVFASRAKIKLRTPLFTTNICIANSLIRQYWQNFLCGNNKERYYSLMPAQNVLIRKMLLGLINFPNCV